MDDLLKEAVNDAIRRSCDLFESKISELNDIVVNQQRELDDLKMKVRSTEVKQNHLEQYSRRSHLRIHGLPIPEGGDCKHVVAGFISKHLKDRDGNSVLCSVTDFDAAHPLPLPKAIKDKDTTTPKTTLIPSIIVRFHSRDLRDRVMYARRSLKGKRSSRDAPKFRITEDLTGRNAALLRRLQEQAKEPNGPYEAAWAWEGRIYVKTKGERKAKKMDIFDA